ncbi:MAG: capsule assembly Wzi family protein [Anditalea sp.]
MNSFHPRIFFFLLFILPLIKANSQSINAGAPVFEEALRRRQLVGEFDSTISFSVRPINVGFVTRKAIFKEEGFFELNKEKPRMGRSTHKKAFALLPVRNTVSFNSKRPYGWGNSLMVPNVGWQNYITAGVNVKFHFLNVQLQPEFTLAQNKPYAGYPNDFNDRINQSRFAYWNVGDFPERYGERGDVKIWWGQSKISLNLGSFETGLSTGNIWWGPGQFNALTFSNNAQGFPHLTLNTTRAAKTFLGSFEGQVIVGRLENSLLEPSQHPELNERYFRKFNGDWRYLNAMTVSYQPKWVPGLTVGFSRTFQQYSEKIEGSFREYMPIFDAFQKTEVGFDKDGEGRDQQVSVFSRFLVPKAKAEIYFEYGRRDHAYNWREFVLNPDHARAYLIGFNKMIGLNKLNTYVQVRGEMLQQQESVNRYIRYDGLGGGISWHTHYSSRGFVNYGEALGVGIGTGSNIQTLEIAYVEGIKKYGLRLERLVNNQDFYYRAFGTDPERKPWVDLSLGILLDYQWNRLVMSSKLQLIHGKNYQWQLASQSSREFPMGKDLFNVTAEGHLIYLF